MIKSVGYSDQEILKNIIKLHCSTDIELDPCYSTGKFYKEGVKDPPNKFDIDPQAPGVLKSDARSLPFGDETFNTIMFDPPFVATTGPSLDRKNYKGNVIARRFGVFPNESELFSFYADSMKEFYRLLKPNGILIFKCQDKISSGKQYFSHVFIINEAIKLGFYAHDLFILIAKNRISAGWQLIKQQHCRKFHSYFLVLRKCNKKIVYTK